MRKLGGGGVKIRRVFFFFLRKQLYIYTVAATVHYAKFHNHVNFRSPLQNLLRNSRATEFKHKPAKISQEKLKKNAKK